MSSQELKAIPGFSKYLVDSEGNIFSTISWKYRKPVMNKATGYYMVVLVGDDGIRKTLSVHRIVASVFCDRPNGYDCVNHKNEIKTDCRAVNLEWCTKAYNNSYNGKNQRCCKPVIGFDEKRNIEVEYPSARIAASVLGASYKNISAACRGLRPRCAGLKWRYANG